jgi:hypothetical protein
MVGRDSVEPKLDFLGRSHGSTESRPTVFVEGGNAIEPQARRYTPKPSFVGREIRQLDGWPCTHD